MSLEEVPAEELASWIRSVRARCAGYGATFPINHWERLESVLVELRAHRAQAGATSESDQENRVKTAGQRPRASAFVSLEEAIIVGIREKANEESALSYVIAAIGAANAVREWAGSPTNVERGIRCQRWHTHGDCGMGRCEHTPEEAMREVIEAVLRGV